MQLPAPSQPQIFDFFAVENSAYVGLVVVKAFSASCSALCSLPFRSPRSGILSLVGLPPPAGAARTSSIFGSLLSPVPGTTSDMLYSSVFVRLWPIVQIHTQMGVNA